MWFVTSDPEAPRSPVGVPFVESHADLLRVTANHPEGPPFWADLPGGNRSTRPGPHLLTIKRRAPDARLLVSNREGDIGARRPARLYDGDPRIDHVGYWRRWKDAVPVEPKFSAVVEVTCPRGGADRESIQR